MNWTTIRAAILDIVSQCVRVDTAWRDRERQFVRPEDTSVSRPDRGVICLLHVFGVRSIQGDEIRQEFNAGTNKIDLTQAGHRGFTVSCLVESYDQSDDRQALEYTERIRSCVSRSQVLDMFREHGLTVNDYSDSVDLSDMEDDHQTSKASIDLMFTYANNETSADGPGLESLDWIESVEGTRTDPPGLDVVAPINENLEGRNE